MTDLFKQTWSIFKNLPLHIVIWFTSKIMEEHGPYPVETSERTIYVCLHPGCYSEFSTWPCKTYTDLFKTVEDLEATLK